MTPRENLEQDQDSSSKCITYYLLQMAATINYVVLLTARADIGIAYRSKVNVIAMAKNKTAQKSSKDVEVKSLSSVKKGAVTKPSQTPKSKSKEMAKQVAVKADKADKKSKKTKKEPTTISSSESESESDDEEASNASSASSDEEAPSPKIAKTNGVKANGVAKAAAKAEESSESSDSSEDQEDEEDEPKPAPAAAAKATVAGAKEEPDSEGTSEGTSEGSSEEDSDEEVEAPVALDAKKLNGKLEKVAPKAVSIIPEDIDYVSHTDSPRQPLMRSLAVRLPLPGHLIPLLTRMMTRKRRRHLRPRSVRPKLTPHPSQRRPRPILEMMTPQRRIFSLGSYHGTSTKNGSHANLRDSANWLV